MSEPASPGNILSWSEDDVGAWLAGKLGYGQHVQQFRENGISGEILVHLDHEALKDLGVHSVGQRLAILKAVYYLKLAHDVPVEQEHYVPASEDLDGADAQPDSPAIDQIVEFINAQDERLRSLEGEYHRLFSALEACREEMATLSRITMKTSPELSLRKQPSFKWAKFSGRQMQGQERSPTFGDVGVPEEGAGALGVEGAETPKDEDGSLTPTHRARLQQPTPTPTSSGPSQSQQVTLAPSPPTSTPPLPTLPPISSSTAAPTTAPPSGGGKPKSAGGDPLKSKSNVKVTLDDPCWRVLPAALRKYKIDDDWRMYALFICYGTTERCLSYDEKPLQLFQKLKEQGQQPVFMLRHVKELKSPIALAQQKQAARREASDPSLSLSSTPGPTPSHTAPAPASAAPLPPAQPYTRDTRLHKPAVLQPLARAGVRAREGELGAGVEADGWAIAIYPYTADREDEFDVAVGDVFAIVTRAKGWWVVQRWRAPSSSPSSSAARPPTSPTAGSEGIDTSASGWVPTGCLLEIASPHDDMPQIVSSSFAAVALMDYTKAGTDEVDMKKDDKLRVYKKHNHWCYVVKDEGGDRGWAPSWFIGSNKHREPSSAMPLSAAPMTAGHADTSYSSAASAGEHYHPDAGGGGGVGGIERAAPSPAPSLESPGIALKNSFI